MFVMNILCIFATILSVLAGVPKNAKSLHEFSIVHINDFHARFEESNEWGGSCKSDKCIGGFSRIYSSINKILNDKPDSIVLNGGDNFQGTLWYNIFKWNVTQFFLNKIPFDATVLGNHEFDDGISGVVPFIKHLKSPVVVSNIDDSLEPSIQGLYNKSVVIERNGLKIGIIGVLIQRVNEMSRTEGLKFFDESESVNAEAERLVREEQVFTNIVLSHSGYDIEQIIAKKVSPKSKIGLVVGAHSHTFLYTGEPLPGPDTPQGPYPTIVKRSDGKEVLVVQASCYAKYLGQISVTYDDNGDYVSHTGEPIYLSSNVEQDEEINEELLPWKEEVDKEGNRVIGSSLVTLEREGCYTSECLLGNFVADAAVHEYTNLADEKSWTYAALSIFNAGGFRTTVNSGNITFSDMMIAQPFENTIDVAEIEGKHLKDTFEFMTSSYNYGRAQVDISLLQTSGFRIVMDLAKPWGSRVTSILVRCNECLIPIYEDLDLKKNYRVIFPSFLRDGGDGYNMFSNNLKNVKVGRVDIDVLVDYLTVRSPIFEEIGDRIVILGIEDVIKNAKNVE